MEKYIPLDAVLAEIEKLYQQHSSKEYIDEAGCVLDKLEDIINTLEVKEVDLEEEMDKEWNKCEPIDEGMGLEIASIVNEQFDNIAKHFFELGMAVSNKAQKGEKV